MRKEIATTLFAFALSATALPAVADTRHATPDTLAARIANVRPGDTIVLSPGDYADVTIRGRSFSPPITIEMSAASASNWLIQGSAGLVISGGQFGPAPPRTSPKTGLPTWGPALRLDKVNAIAIRDARFVGPGRADAATSKLYGEGIGLSAAGGTHIEVTRSAFSGFKVGVVMSNIENLRLVGNTFTAMRADAMDVAGTKNALIEDNECSGTVIRDTEHPDCIQLWSRPGSPVSDIVIRKNRATGATQGIGMFNHVRNGIDDGGYDRILIEDNDIYISAPQGIALIDGRDSVVRNNHVRTAAGAKFRASINVQGGSVTRCGNVTAPGAGKPGLSDPRC